jgi:hypothetical protein
MRRQVRQGESAGSARRRCMATLSSAARRVKAMKALLPQVSGFEGFLLRLVQRERRLLAVPNGDQPGASSLNFHAVASSHVCDVLCDEKRLT